MTTKQSDRLENWSQDFIHFFGWPTTVSDVDFKTVVDISAPRHHYTIEAQGDTLNCIAYDKQSGQRQDLARGDFDFFTFGRIMMEILHCEAPSRRHAVLNFLRNLKRSNN